jgi:hypothetical protein
MFTKPLYSTTEDVEDAEVKILLLHGRRGG